MNENFETKLKAAVKEAIYDCDRADEWIPFGVLDVTDTEKTEE